MKFLSKLKSYCQNKTIIKDTKIYSFLIIGSMYFIGFFKVLMSGSFDEFSVFRFTWVSLLIIPIGILVSFWYAVHENMQVFMT